MIIYARGGGGGGGGVLVLGDLNILPSTNQDFKVLHSPTSQMGALIT